MDHRKIREKYGGKLPKAINRAIRAEIPGGNEALDKLTQLAGAARHSGWKDRAGNPTEEAAAYFRHQREVIDRMDAEVRKRWGVPPDAGRHAEAAPQTARAAGAPRAGRRQGSGPGRSQGERKGNPQVKGRGK